MVLMSLGESSTAQRNARNVSAKEIVVSLLILWELDKARRVASLQVENVYILYQQYVK
jgi:hypothetical protein